MSSIQTLEDVRKLVRDISASLDPDSRYISDLLATVAASTDIKDFEQRLLVGCRAQRHSGTDVFAAMTLSEKIRANLITPETALFRFTEGEMEALDREILPRLKGRIARVLIVPCSHGEEAFTIASYFLKSGQDFRIKAFDIQPALIAEARSGRLTFGFPIDFLETPGLVSRRVLNQIQFEVGDAFALPLSPDEKFEIAICRNFLGYFIPDKAAELTRNLLARLSPNGVLFVDQFCLQKNTAVLDELNSRKFKRAGARPVFFAP